jgi:hypothetical protein
MEHPMDARTSKKPILILGDCFAAAIVKVVAGKGGRGQGIHHRCRTDQ